MAESRYVKTWALRVADYGHSEELQPDRVTEVRLDNDNRTLSEKRISALEGNFDLKLGFEDQLGNKKWFSGTGWLIQDDILVTAGHCVYMHNHKLRHAVSIKAYLGYPGRNSKSQDDVEAMYGCWVTTPIKWTNERHIPYDVAFIRLAGKFNNVTTVAYDNTPPILAEEELLVVGYPGDLPVNGEGGSLMYMGTGLVSYDLNKSYYKGMLEYKVSTSTSMFECFARGSFEPTDKKGSSGSPVLRQKDGKLVAIGTHRGGSSTHEMNTATAIGRTLDTDIRYDIYEEFLDGIDKGHLWLDQMPLDYDLVKMTSLTEETIAPALNRTVG